MMVNNLVGGFSPTPLKKYDFVSWDDDIPNIWTNENVPDHQPVINHGTQYI